MKIWTSDEKGNDKIIVFKDETIYKGNPKEKEIEKILFELKVQGLISKTLVGFPLSYIQEISLQEGKNFIELLFAEDSSEHLKINDEKKKNEVFDYFKENIPNSKYSLEKLSFLQAAKKPLIAGIVIAVFFVATLYFAIELESGNQYYIEGDKYNSITGIVLALAQMGVTNVILLFGSLFLIALSSFVIKGKKPPVINKLTLYRR